MHETGRVAQAAKLTRNLAIGHAWRDHVIHTEQQVPQYLHNRVCAIREICFLLAMRKGSRSTCSVDSAGKSHASSSCTNGQGLQCLASKLEIWLVLCNMEFQLARTSSPENGTSESQRLNETHAAETNQALAIHACQYKWHLAGQ